MDFDRWKQKRILVVDDEQGLLQMVVSILNQDGYTQIKTAGTVRGSAWRLSGMDARTGNPGCDAAGRRRLFPV